MKIREELKIKKRINVFDHAGDILHALKTGVLLTTKSNGKVNTMAISWGLLGIEWNRPIFTVFVRDNRFTRQQLDESGEFTINIPTGVFNRRILGYCGSRSGRDVDKIAALGLSLEDGELISAPGIKELPLTLECRVVYSQRQDEKAVPPEFKEIFYPAGVPGTWPGENQDYHIAYYGEIVNAYILE